MGRPRQLKLALVPAGRETAQQTQQARETRARWAWAEAAVWTNRMLAALEKGVQGGKGQAHLRWPNAYFKKLGLLSLLGLREEYSQSLRGTH